MIENTRLQITSIVGDIRQGGTIVSGRIDGDTDALSYGDNLRLMGKSNSDFDDPVWREFFNGHILEDPDYEFDALESHLTFRAGTANYLMKGRIQDVAFTEQSVPANDHQIAPTMRLSMRPTITCLSGSHSFHELTFVIGALQFDHAPSAYQMIDWMSTDARP